MGKIIRPGVGVVAQSLSREPAVPAEDRGGKETRRGGVSDAGSPDSAAIIARIAAASRMVDPRDRAEELKLARVALDRLINREAMNGNQSDR